MWILLTSLENEVIQGMITVARLKRIAGDYGTLTAVADMIKVSKCHYSHWEKGTYAHVHLKPAQVAKLADILNCRPDEIADERGEALIWQNE